MSRAERGRGWFAAGLALAIGGVVFFSLRPIFIEIVNPFEFDPWGHDALEPLAEGRHRLRITAELVREALAK